MIGGQSKRRKYEIQSKDVAGKCNTRRGQYAHHVGSVDTERFITAI